MPESLADLLARADHCHGIVTRDGELDACGKPPVAIIDGRGTEDEGYWPACAYHANRYGGGRVVPLARIVAEAQGAALREAADAYDPDGEMQARGWVQGWLVDRAEAVGRGEA